MQQELKQDPAHAIKKQDPAHAIKIEILKEGRIIQVLEFLKSKISFGRLEENDLVLEHPSSSRSHAVIEAQNNGYFLMDLGSAHGTFLNKIKIPAKENVQVYAGDFIVFGQSSRKYILQVKDERKESVPLQNSKRKSGKIAQNSEISHIKSMDQDDINEVRLMGKLISIQVWKNDPKGVLSNWFEQQGYELNVEILDEEDSHELIGRLRMPVEIVNMLVEVKGKSQKRKDLELQVCLEGCKKLYERGLLVDSEAQMTEKEKRKIRNEMFGDSDDDDDLIYDKTMKKKRTTQTKPETFESLSGKRLLLIAELEDIMTNLTQTDSQSSKEEEEDSLDAFMNIIESKKKEKDKVALEKRIPGLKQELEKVEKLLEIVRPSALVSGSNNHIYSDTQSSSNFKMPMPVMKSPGKSTELKYLDRVDESVKASDKKIQEVEETMEDRKDVRQYGAMTMDESFKHDSVETNDVEEAPDLDYRRKSEILDQNAAYGY